MSPPLDLDGLLARLRRTFLAELEEHVRTFNRNLLALESAGAGLAPEQRAALIDGLFRAAHSLKGAARAVNLELVGAACHRIETVLAAMRSSAAEAPGVFEALFVAADALQDAGERLRDGRALEEVPLPALVDTLEALAARLGDGPPASRPARAAGPPPAAPRPASPLASPPQSPAVPDEGHRLSEAGVVRVAREKLDALLDHAAELQVARTRLERLGDEVAHVQGVLAACQGEWRRLEPTLARRATGDHPDLPREAMRALRRFPDNLLRLSLDLERLAASVARGTMNVGHIALNLDEKVRRVRMIPVLEACQGLDRLVRDLARACDKQVDLVLEGALVELDRAVLDRLADPLRHLVGNAIDHGVEPPEARIAAGKPARARVVVSATLRGPEVEIAVADDGRGLDLRALRRVAAAAGLAAPAEDAEAARLVFHPGLTTVRFVTEVSGRGMGLDVVKRTVDALYGTVDVASEPGRGTRFVLTVPLTLTRVPVLQVEARGQALGLVAAHVRALAPLRGEEARAALAAGALQLGDQRWPVATLQALLGLPMGPAPEPWPAVVLGVGDLSAAVLVDALGDEIDAVLKPLGPRLAGLRHVAGATVLPDGRLALVLDALELARRAARPTAPSATGPLPGVARPEPRHVLVVDDSATIRLQQQRLLEEAGYRVSVAGDGSEAWQVLQDQGVDLVVCDVEMPGMDGLTFTRTVRASERFGSLPIVLVTARDAAADVARGRQAGADAYLTKKGFDARRLLETIARLV